MSVIQNMNQFRFLLLPVILLLQFQSCQSQVGTEKADAEKITVMHNENSFKVNKSEAEWKEILSPEEYYVLREAGTERPHTGKYNLHFEDGTYVCNACGEKLFESGTKFDGHCGWPSFDKAIKGKVTEKLDRSHGMTRMEILCANCGSHLGHVFNDGPTETGLRYCVNSLSLDFENDSIK